MASRIGYLRILVLAGSDTSVRVQREQLEAWDHECLFVDAADAALARLREDTAISVLVVDETVIADDVGQFLQAVYVGSADRELTVLGCGSERLRTALQEQGERLFLPSPWTARDVVQRVEQRRLGMGLMNLHDVWLNADLLKRVMDTSPVHDGQDDDQDRFRAERIWIAMLAVLVESWERGSGSRHAVEFLRGAVDTSRLVDLLRSARRKPAEARMVEVRHYVCHRDERGYWDRGRTAPYGQLDFFIELHSEFKRIFDGGFRALQMEREARGPATEAAGDEDSS